MIRFALGQFADTGKWCLCYVDSSNVPLMHISKMDTHFRKQVFTSTDEAISHLNTFAAGYKIHSPDVQFKVDPC